MEMERLVGLAENGERKAVAALKETAKYLGLGISNLIIGFSPQAIIVCGAITKAWDVIADDIHELSLRSIRHELSSTRVVPSTLGEEPTVLGSISLVLARKFASAT
jgi:predicted NBD/HSP70 family sugar kinase